MRILYVHNINHVAQTHSNDLTRRGHSVEVYEPSLIGADAPLPIKLTLMPARILDLRHVIGRLNPDYFDLVHIHWASYGVLGLISQIPFIVECHGADVLFRLQQPSFVHGLGADVLYRLKRPLFHPLLTSIFLRAAAVMCITPDLLPIVQSIRPDAIFFPAPIDTERFAPRRDIQPQPWTILLFARLDPDKGVDIATQGIERFVLRHPDVRVRIIDYGSLRAKYKQRYGKRFEFIPRIAQEEVQHLIWSADVVVGQFALGALGLSELQAMSCAKPVIASFLYEGAYPSPPPLCQATAAEEVDEHLEYLFQHPEAAMALGQRAREWVSHYHDCRTLGSKLETLYQSIVSGKFLELAPFLN
jgi:glycosyltransferase involved in cell wall biosynthesis